MNINGITISNYNNEYMLIGANKKNQEVEKYLALIEHESFDDVDEVLREFKLDLEEYINDIRNYNFRNAQDNIEKETILNRLEVNLQNVKRRLVSEPEVENRGGGKRRRNKRRTRKMRKTRKTRRNKRRTRKHNKK